jgi:glycerophosphoryl diester phosphodiesterase
MVYYAAQALWRTPPLSGPQVIAHRGGAEHAPENTLAAFRHAVALGADMLEFDVQMTKDEELVVIHDETVDRTTDGSGAVRDLTLAEIRSLNAGNGELVPTFGEVIAQAKADGVRVLPEAKSPQLYPGVEEKMLRELQEAGYLDQAVIQSFDADSLNRLRALEPHVELCALRGLWGFDLGAPAGEAQYVCPMAEMALLYPDMIRQAHREGRKVFVWFLGTESPLTIDVLRSFGADGFIVDDPAAAREALEE